MTPAPHYVGGLHRRQCSARSRSRRPRSSIEHRAPNAQGRARVPQAEPLTAIHDHRRLPPLGVIRRYAGCPSSLPRVASGHACRRKSGAQTEQMATMNPDSNDGMCMNGCMQTCAYITSSRSSRPPRSCTVRCCRCSDVRSCCVRRGLPRLRRR